MTFRITFPFVKTFWLVVMGKIAHQITNNTTITMKHRYVLKISSRDIVKE